MKKVISIFSILVICLFVLSVFGWMSHHITKGDKDFGFLNEPVTFMITFLDQFETTVEEVKKLPPTFLKTDAHHEAINKLENDLNVLVTYSESESKRKAVLMNLKNDSILYEWKIPEKVNSHKRVMNPILYPNKDLIYFFDMKVSLKRIDSLGNEIWFQDSIVPHHAMNLDSAGNLWVCANKKPPYRATGRFKMYGRDVYFIDDYLTQINANTGEVLFNKSIAEIFKANQMGSYLLHSQSGKDPLHLNDIQPALKTTKWYKEGDLFVSLKQISLIFQYRPSTNEVIRAIKGPFSAQHDVDFYNDSTLSWFNNNYYALWTEDSKPKPPKANEIELTDEFFSNVIHYDLSTEEFEIVGKDIFKEKWIFTANEGLHEYINDSTYFIEQQNQGILWMIQNDEILYRDVIESQHEGHHHLPNWTRIITK